MPYFLCPRCACPGYSAASESRCPNCDAPLLRHNQVRPAIPRAESIRHERAAAAGFTTRGAAKLIPTGNDRLIGVWWDTPGR
jgi:hypothetical protein